MADLCPLPTWRNLPELDRRRLPGVFFAPACLPGAATSSGCPARATYYTIALSWEDFIAKGHIAPGGNRYWSEWNRKLSTYDPVVVALLRSMATASMHLWRTRVRFQATNAQAAMFRRDGLKHFKTVDAVLATGRWVTNYGIISVETQPVPGETLDAFTARGGYLLNVEAERGHIYDEPSRGSPLLGVRAIESYAPKWPGAEDIRQIELWGKYIPAEGTVSYWVRVDYKGVWDKAWDTLSGAASWVCAQTSSAETQTAIALAEAFPPTAAYAGAVAAAARVCAVGAIVSPPCIPRAPADPANLYFIDESRALLKPTGRGDVLRADFALMPGSGVKAQSPTTPTPSPAQETAFPPGTIAYQDPAQPGFKIAVPQPGSGTTHRPVGVTPTAPLGAQVVDRGEWERATLPWVRRRTSKIGLMAGGVVVALVGTAAALRATT